MADNQSSHCTIWNTLVLITPEAASGWLYTKLETVLYLTIMLSIFLIGIASNSAFFVMLVRIPRMRTTVNLYLANLAVADILFLTMNVFYYTIVMIYSPIKENLPFHHRSVCALLFSPTVLLYYASICIVTVLTVDRFLAICHPLSHRYMKGKARAAKLLSLVWMLSTGPAAFTSLRYARNTQFCIKWSEEDAYQNLPQTMNLCMTAIQSEVFNIAAMIVFLAFFFVSMIVNILMYAGIIITLNPKNRAATEDTNTKTVQFQIRNQIARMLVTTGIVFFVLQLPLRFYTLGSLIRIFGETPVLTDGQRQLLLIIGRIAALINSGTNSILYVFVSPFYRKTFHEAFSCAKIKDDKNSMKAHTVSSRVVGHVGIAKVNAGSISG